MQDAPVPASDVSALDRTLRLLRALGLAGVLGGLGALSAMWAFSASPATNDEWRLLVGAMRAVFYACVFTGVLILIPVGSILWWRRRAGLRGQRWFRALMLVLLVPTMVWVQLRLPKLSRVVEFVCLLPLTIPAIVLVVGLAPVYRGVWGLLGESPNTLTFVYVVLVLPFAYRALQANLDAIDTRTLAEAARSLGASWGRVLLRVIAPNVRRGLMMAGLISVAVVLGEFTIASLLNRQNLQTALVVVSKIDPFVAVIMSLLSLALVFVLLLVIDRVGRLLTVRSGR